MDTERISALSRAHSHLVMGANSKHQRNWVYAEEDARTGVIEARYRPLLRHYRGRPQQRRKPRED